jgi:hypothetical protein
MFKHGNPGKRKIFTSVIDRGVSKIMSVKLRFRGEGSCCVHRVGSSARANSELGGYYLADPHRSFLSCLNLVS